jgi:hypothetical protein
MATPELFLRTAYVMTDAGRIASTREPIPEPGPLFTVVRSTSRCAWAVRHDVPDNLAHELDMTASNEPVPSTLDGIPTLQRRYRQLLGALVTNPDELIETSGPGLLFPDVPMVVAGVEEVHDEGVLKRHFRGWTQGEISAGRAPVFAVYADGDPVSVCFCARRSAEAAEAGVETAPAFRGRRFAARVTAAWARSIRSAGLVPLYSTDSTNHASRSVARQLGLMPYATTWSIWMARPGIERRTGRER